MTSTLNVHQKAMLQQTLPICQSPAHVPARRGGGKSGPEGLCLKLNRGCLQLPGHKRLTKKNANMRMHTNEQPRQSGDKQELINASYLFCLPMGSLIHLFGELFFSCSKTVQSEKIFNICSDQSKKEGKMQPTIWLICIHMEQSARMFSNNS